MRPRGLHPGTTGREEGRPSALLAALLAVCAAACATAPRPVATGPADGPFALRDPRDGAPPPSPTGREAKALDAALAALRRGDAPSASKALAASRRGTGDPAPALRLAAAYVAILDGRRDEARDVLSGASSAHPTWVAAVEAAADLAADEGATAVALERYRSLLRLVPSDERARARVESLRASLAAAKRAEAEAALASGDLDGARRSAHALLQLEPDSAVPLVLLARTAAAGGGNEDAWTWAREARRKAPADANVVAFAADAAAKAGRWADAASLYEEVAASDPAFTGRAEEARREFKIQNLPEAARRAAGSPRLTRAQLASLLWWTVPEFREALVPPGTEIAVDVVGRSDQGPLVKAIGLGFLDVSPETHRVGTEAAVTRADLPGALRRVAELAGRGRAPTGCLAPRTPTVSALAVCGILNETPARDVSGREALRALEKAARLGREGGTK